MHQLFVGCLHKRPRLTDSALKFRTNRTRPGILNKWSHSAPARTQAIAKHLLDFMQKTDPMGKTLVFCVDQEHALAMRKELQALLSADAQRAM